MKIALNTLALYKTKVGMGKYIVELCTRLPKIDPNNQYILYVSQENKKYFQEKRANVTLKVVSKLFTYPFFKVFWEQLVLPFSLWKNKIDLYHGLGFTLPVFQSKKINDALRSGHN